MIFSFFHIWLASVEFRREKSSRWYVASNFLNTQTIETIIDVVSLDTKVRNTFQRKHRLRMIPTNSNTVVSLPDQYGSSTELIRSFA